MQGLGHHCVQKLYRTPLVQPAQKPLTPSRPERLTYIGGGKKNLLAARRGYEFPVREQFIASVRSADLEEPLIAHTSGNGVSKVDETLKSLEYFIKPSADDSKDGVFDSQDDGQADQSPSSYIGGRAAYEVRPLTLIQ